MPSKGRILFLDNDLYFSRSLSKILELEGYEVVLADSPYEAEQIILRKEFPIHLVIADIRVEDNSDPGDDSGLRFAERVAPTIPKIILTGFPSFEFVRKALGHQENQDLPVAIDFISKSDGPQVLLEAVNRAFKTYVKINTPEVKVGGSLTTEDDPFYVKRQAEKELLRHLENMNYVLVIEPRQQGKTSLINYAIRRSESNETIILYLDVTGLNRSTQEEWYRNIYERLSEQLRENGIDLQISNLSNNPTGWRQFLYRSSGSAKAQQKKLVIALDETGVTPILYATNFFSVMRDVYNSRQAEPVFHHLAFMLVGTFHPRDLISDDKFSPFNIAQRVRLYDFEQNQFNHLILAMEWPEEKTNAIAERIFYWTSGQPYLTQKLCESLRFNMTPKDIDKSAKLLQRQDDNHLPPIFRIFKKDKEGQEYIKRILDGEEITFFPMVDQQQADLELLGVIKADDDGNCMIRNRIYEQAFLAFFKLVSPKPGISNHEARVFVSYAWGGESERIVDELEQAFLKRSIRIVRDKKELDYKDSIEAFEQSIGRGQCIVLVISDKYLRSKHCMYELIEVDRNQNLRDRIFPIVLAEAQIYETIDRLNYIKHWDKQIDELNQAIKEVDVITHLSGFTDDLNKYASIRASFDHLTDLLSDMNALTPQIHAANGFSTLISAVERAIAKNKTGSSGR